MYEVEDSKLVLKKGTVSIREAVRNSRKTKTGVAV